MQDNIDEVRRSGTQAKKLTVRHVRDPCQGMPVRLVKARKCPHHITEVQTGVHMGVFGNVEVIIKEIDEPITPDWEIQHQGGEHQQYAEQNRFLAKLGRDWLSMRGDLYRRFLLRSSTGYQHEYSV